MYTRLLLSHMMIYWNGFFSFVSLRHPYIGGLYMYMLFMDHFLGFSGGDTLMIKNKV